MDKGEWLRVSAQGWVRVRELEEFGNKMANQ